jgi:Fe2+ or Zn2+ uptake regulation protein
MGEKREEIFTAIKKALLDGPKSINEISKKAKINWITAEENLKFLKELGIVGELEIKNTRTFYYKDPENYFKLPIKEKDSETISTYYYHIKKSCQDILKKDLTKTQAYKILWVLNKKLSLNLPIGWYKYGPCCVQIFKGSEKEKKLEKKELNLIKETTLEYAKLEREELENKIYLDENKKVYLTKKELLNFCGENKDELNILLMNFVMQVPKETQETVTDFVRATMMLGFQKTKDHFSLLWDYIAQVLFKESLKFYFGDSTSNYFDEKIAESKKEIEQIVSDLVLKKIDAKFAQDKLYQRWVKGKK